MSFRIGQGFDIHRLAIGKKLVIGGVIISDEFGAIAHSDGDVLLHAIIDAILGALALGDIGTFFPDNDEKYRNISSIILLKDVLQFSEIKKYQLINLDCTIHLEAPKLQSFCIKIRKNLAKIFSTDLENISIKAKTSEKIGEIGKNQAISANAIILLKKNQEVKI